MEDQAILKAFDRRDEDALESVQRQYGAYLRTVAGRILDSAEDAEEAVSDAMLAAWNSIPPQRPENLRTYLAKLTRRASLKIRRAQQAGKRGGGEADAVYEEIADCLAGEAGGPEEALEAQALTHSIEGFLEGLPKAERAAFILRYWYFKPVREIASQLGFTESKTGSMLLRSRRKLRTYLEEEGFWL